MSVKSPARQLGRAKVFAAAVLSAALALLLILVPGPALSGARHGLSLCGDTVIPSLFPFLVLSSFIIGSGLADSCGRLFEPFTRHVFRLPGSAWAALLLGAIGGYPVGASAVAKLRKTGSLTKREAERLLCCSINSSPAFIIGAVGAGFLGSTKAGLLLYAAHLSASASIGLLMRPHGAPKFPEHTDGACVSHNRTAKRFSAAFVASVTGSARSVIVISAFVVLFSSLNALIDHIGVFKALAGVASSLLPTPAADPQFYRRAVGGILEVTNGCAAAAGSSGMAAVLLTAACLGFSGLSVQFQVISLIGEAGLSSRHFILTRFLHVALSVLFAWALFSIFPAAIPPDRSVFAIASDISVVQTSFHSAPAVCAMLFICVMLLLSLAKV